MDVAAWVSAHGGIAHRSDALEAGFSAARLRAAVNAGSVRRVRRYWLATETAPDDLLRAASATARVACVSAARRRGWWLPERVDGRLHLHVARHGAVPATDAVLHWSDPVAPVSRRALVESVPDTLRHIADCVPHEQALVLWESAVRTEKLAPELLRSFHWPSTASQACAKVFSGLSDSGLETIFLTRLRPWGLAIRQQVRLAGHPVDFLIGDRLVIQLDGFAHHSTSADRTRDVAHDAQLRLRGYTVFRFTYAQIVHGWPAVERTLTHAIAARLHLAA